MQGFQTGTTAAKCSGSDSGHGTMMAMRRINNGNTLAQRGKQ